MTETVSDSSSEVVEFMITTHDNPFNPHSQFNEWFSFDVKLGYNSLSLLGRIARTSPDLSSFDEKVAINRAIDEIIKEDLLGIYKKVQKNWKPNQIVD